jgi:hypothetical protein
MRSFAVPATAVLLMATLALGQERVAENPFPETGTPQDSAQFAPENRVTFTGIITREIIRSAEGGYLFLRMDVSDQRGTVMNWVVRMPKVPAAALSARGPILITDYSPEMARLKPGTRVTVNGYQAKDQSRRLVLIPSTSPESVAGVVVHR